MNRRNLLVGSAAVAMASTFPSIAVSKEIPFTMPAFHKGSENMLNWFLRNKFLKPVEDILTRPSKAEGLEIAVSIEKIPMNTLNKYEVADALMAAPKFDRVSGDSISKVVIASNEIAKVSRRGRGNHIIRVPNGVIVFYQGSNEFDTCVKEVGNGNYLLNPDFENYVRFVELDHTKYSDEDFINVGFKTVV